MGETRSETSPSIGVFENYYSDHMTLNVEYCLNEYDSFSLKLLIKNGIKLCI